MNLTINKKIILITFISIIFIMSFAGTVITNAEEGFVPLQEIPGVIDAETAENPSLFFNAMFNFGIVIAGFLAVIMIAIGGIQYMSTDAIHGKSEGREKITAAIMGLLLILFSYILLSTINPDILKFDLFKKTGTGVNNTRILQPSSNSVDVDISASIPTATDDKIKELEEFIKSGNLSPEEIKAAQGVIDTLKKQQKNP